MFLLSRKTTATPPGTLLGLTSSIFAKVARENVLIKPQITNIIIFFTIWPLTIKILKPLWYTIILKKSAPWGNICLAAL